MSSDRICEFLIDEENEEKFWSHGLTVDRVLDILDRRYTVVPNRKGRRGVYLLIGRDRSGECLAVPVEATHDPVVWRPVTAWRCKDVERARLPRER
jgi:hypothetical protein